MSRNARTVGYETESGQLYPYAPLQGQRGGRLMSDALASVGKAKHPIG
jgi:hypothetical protein